MQYWQRFTNYFNPRLLLLAGIASILAFLLAPAPPSSGCGPVDRRFQGYSFLQAAIVDPQAKAAPFFLSFEELYEAFGGQEKTQIEDNILEWHERFCELPTQQDIYQIVYKADLNTMERIRIAALNPRMKLDVVLDGNSFARHLVRDRCIEVIDYLIFAKKCEPHVTPGADPWEKTPRNRTAMEGLIEEGRKFFFNPQTPNYVESHYVRLRYVYQLVRLAHYSGQYRRALTLYDELMPMVDNDPSLIEHWIEGHRAGAMMALDSTVHAAYLYSRVFENCPSKRESAFRSFRIQSDEEWEACLDYCRDDRERATLYALRAHDVDSRAVEEMEKIYDLDPRSEHLEVLLVRDMRKLERNLLGLEFNDHRRENERYHDIPKPWAGEYVIALQAFVRRVTREGKAPRLALWKIAEGYLELLAGEYYYAARTFENARALLDRRQEALRRQLATLELALRISSWNRMTDTVEVAAANMMRNDPVFQSDADFRDFLFDKMAFLYQRTNEPGMAFLSRYPLNYLRPNPRPELIDNLLIIVRQEDRNRFEKMLVEPREGETIKNDLLDMQAVYQLSQNLPEAALETLKKMDPEWDNYGLFNPFVERLRDCVVDCKLPPSVPVYNRRDLIDRLLGMEYEAKAGAPNADSLYYQLGLGWYNMTYFGHAWQAMDYFRSGASLSEWNLKDGDNVIPHYRYPYGNRENFDCARPLYFFEKARQLTENPELAARAAYWAAKCERNAYYVNRFRPGATRTYEHFRILQENYSDTKYYQRLIRECKTFEAYLAGRL